MNEVNPYAPPASRVEDVAPPSLELPFFAVGTTKLVLMSACTFGLYDLYWFYKNWKLVKDRERSNISPFWRAFFGVFFCYGLFTKIAEYEHPALNLRRLPAGALAAGWIIFTVTWRLPDPYSYLSLFSFIFMIPVQRHVNRINHEVEPTHDPNTRLSWLNWIAIVLGGLLILLMIAEPFIPELPEE